MTLGVLGTMVWDRIDHPDGETLERWGGITYSLAAAAAAVPDGWTIRPLIKLGRDLAEEAWAFLESVPGLELPGGVEEVDEPNNRVHLRYRDRHDREEVLSGGVSAWGWSELAPRLEGLDGLYVNLISGFELEPTTATRIRDVYQKPRYVDLHSLVLGVADDGRRVPRRPKHVDTWLGAFHAVQVNETELRILADAHDPDTVARRAIEVGARAVLVTRGPAGARWFAPDDAPLWPARRAGGGHRAGRPGVPDPAERDPGGRRPVVRSGEVGLPGPWTKGDPTGCGDVWGATCFAHLMDGRRLTAAMEAGNRAAARNVDHRGADGLHGQLKAVS